MTVLGQHDIERSISRGEIGAVRGGGRPLQVEPASMDLHLGSELTRLSSRRTVKVNKESTYPRENTVDMDEFGKSSRIDPNEFVLGTTEETISVPRGKVAILHGRSSVGRLGLFIENAGLIDPNFTGNITLELYNAANYPIQLKSGMRIGQLTFHDIKNAPDVGYSKKNGNKYMNQSGPTSSKLYEDFE